MAASTLPSLNFIVYSERLARDLWEAVADGDIPKVQSLLNQGADPNHHLYWRKEWCDSQYTGWYRRFLPLHTACYKGNLEIVKLLIDQGGAKVGELIHCLVT